jgi:predicted phosphoribosyltransferase
MEEEKNEMMTKLHKIQKQDFDNTKRIERPEEILERRKRERERRNVWYRKWGRWILAKRE